MFHSKLIFLALSFLVVGTAWNYVQGMPLEEDEYPINAIGNEGFEEVIPADKNGVVDDEEVEEGDTEERNVLNELDVEPGIGAEETDEDEENESDWDEEELEEEIVDDEEEDEPNEEEELEDEEEENKATDEEELNAEEEEAAAEEEEEVVDEIPEKKSFPYNWYDKVKKYFLNKK